MKYLLNVRWPFEVEGSSEHYELQVIHHDLHVDRVNVLLLDSTIESRANQYHNHHDNSDGNSTKSNCVYGRWRTFLAFELVDFTESDCTV